MDKSITGDTRFQEAIRRLDEANREDPRTEKWEGCAHPKEWLYARRMTAWLDRLEPQASEALRLAVRAQHLRRWEHPRGDYPMDRAGYLRWRTNLYQFHARKAAEILEAVGYDAVTVGRVSDLIKKKHLRSDEEAATLEDVACLVFLEFYFADFAPDHEEEKVIQILQRTWRKMSVRGRAAALKIELEGKAKALVERALGEEN